MKLKYSASFRLEQRKNKKTGEVIMLHAPIMLIFTYEKKRFAYFIGYRIDASKWNNDSEEVKKNVTNKDGIQYNIINSHINNVRSLITNIYDKAKTNNIPVDNEYLKANLINALGNVKTQNPSNDKTLFWDKWNEYLNNAKFSEGRKKSMRNTMNHLQHFETQNKRSTLSFETLSPTLISKFENFLLNDNSEKKDYEGLKKHKIPKQKGQNTASANLKRFRAFLYWCMKKENGAVLKDNPFSEYNIKGEVYGTPIIITKEERDYLFNLNIKNNRLAKVRDMFCFQCLIGCRVGDFLTLTKNDVIDNVLIYYPNKTKENRTAAKIPLSNKAKEILKRYEDLPDNQLLPFISSDKYNKYLKELFKLAELNRIVTRLNPLTMEKEQIPLSDMASSHLARRTFIHILHKNVKDSVIASMSGHVKDSKAFNRYYDIEDEERASAINTYLD